MDYEALCPVCAMPAPWRSVLTKSKSPYYTSGMLTLVTRNYCDCPCEGSEDDLPAVP